MKRQFFSQTNINDRTLIAVFSFAMFNFNCLKISSMKFTVLKLFFYYIYYTVATVSWFYSIFHKVNKTSSLLIAILCNISLTPSFVIINSNQFTVFFYKIKRSFLQYITLLYNFLLLQYLSRLKHEIFINYNSL